MTSAPCDPVLIIGGGISCLCLAQGLKKLNVPFKVFERNAETAARAQGYRVRLLDGVEVIEEVTPAPISALFKATTAVFEFGVHKYNAITREIRAFTEAGGMDQAPVGMRPHLTSPDVGGSPHAAASVDRRVLRDVPMTGIGEHVLFGKTYSHFETDDDRTCVTAYFTDGQHVPDHVMLDTGYGGFYGKTPLTAELRDIFDRNTALRGLVVVSDTQTLSTPLNLLMGEMVWSSESRSNDALVAVPKDYIYWVLLSERASLPYLEEELEGRVRSGDAAAQATVDLTKGWTAELRKIIACQAPQKTSYISVHSASPNMVAWRPSRCVTLVGDAVHGMPPFAALGANTALRGAQMLCRVIERHGVEGLTEDIIGLFEEELRVLAVEKIEQSFESGQVAFRLKSPGPGIERSWEIGPRGKLDMGVSNRSLAAFAWPWSLYIIKTRLLAPPSPTLSNICIILVGQK
ncbi:hypothetical protein PG994_013300 [Apiospora phragmitis]|uniref:FAD-binding domain-containing protein n=1 Tax=Apiospora phragmitis TaxID=2905665 RepID=A0ABR1T8S2_9PEZI